MTPSSSISVVSHQKVGTRGSGGIRRVTEPTCGLSAACRVRQRALGVQNRIGSGGRARADPPAVAPGSGAGSASGSLRSRAQATAETGSSVSVSSSSSDANAFSSSAAMWAWCEIGSSSQVRTYAASMPLRSIVASCAARARISEITYASRSPASRSTISQRCHAALTPSAPTVSPPRKSGTASSGRICVTTRDNASASAARPKSLHTSWRSS